MGTENYANGQVIYTSEQDMNRMCIDDLKDDAHYRFECRCGCGAAFAGGGNDIKWAAKLGRPFKPMPAPAKPVVEVEVVNAVPATEVEMSKDEKDEQINDARIEQIEKVRPFVSDRYLQKAFFNLTDEEIDEVHRMRNETSPDDAARMADRKLADRNPPGVGSLVRSLATGDGPFTLLEHVHKELEDADGGKHRVLCGLVLNQAGKVSALPLADLDLCDDKWTNDRSKTGGWFRTVVYGSLMVLSAAIGSSAIIAIKWALLGF